MSRRGSVTLTNDQERRLVEAIELIVDAEASPVAAPSRRVSFWRHPLVVPALSFVAVLAVFLPLRLATNDPVVEPEDTASTTAEAVADVVRAGEAHVINDATAGSRVEFHDSALYTVTAGAAEQILRSDDGGKTWETVLSAHPGDGEGLFTVGELVVQVVEDDQPARDTVEVGSVVSEAPRVLVYDPQTGRSFETTLPRPDEPEMTGLPLEGTSSCALGGYQSSIRAGSVAVGDRLLVVGTHQLVGELASGLVMCDRAYRHVAWTSDDGGATWEIHDVPSVGSIAWTGSRFIGWSPSGETGARDILTSDDGVAWTAAASTSTAPDEGIAVGPAQFSVAGDHVIGLVEFHTFTAEIPQDATYPEDLREVLNLKPANETDVTPEEILEMLGVDLPLDESEREIIARFNGSTLPSGAIIATSKDAGDTWEINAVDEPIAGVAISGNTYLAMSTNEPAGGTTTLLTSPTGAEWDPLAELPIRGTGSTLTASFDAIYLTDANTGDLWTLPIDN